MFSRFHSRVGKGAGVGVGVSVGVGNAVAEGVAADVGVGAELVHADAMARTRAKPNSGVNHFFIVLSSFP